MTAFLGKLKEGIVKGIAIGAKPKDLFDATVLKKQIDALSNQKRGAVEELGDTVYTLFLRGASDKEAVRKRCLAVVSLDGRRFQKEERLRQIRLRSKGTLSHEPCASGNDTVEDTQWCADPGLPDEGSDAETVCPTCGPLDPPPAPGGTPQEGESDLTQAGDLGAADVTSEVAGQGEEQGVDEAVGGWTAPDAKRRYSRGWDWPALAAGIVLIVIAGGYLFHAREGNPLSVETRLNRELSERGLGATCVVAKDGTATIVGSVRTQQEKELAMAIVKADKHIIRVSDATASPEDVRIVKDRLSFVVQRMLLLENAIAMDDALGKHFLKGADDPLIEKPYAIFMPETYGAFSVADDGTMETTIRNIAREVNDKTLLLKPSPDLKVRHRVSAIDKSHLPVRTEDEIREVTPLPSSPPPPKPPHKKPRILRHSTPVIQAHLAPARHLSSQSSVPPALPAPLDPANLEGEINKSLRTAGIKGVTAEMRAGMGLVLKGTASSTAEKQKALQIAKSFNGSRDVKDIVFVIEE
jgi:hypothetical protein